MPKFVQDVIDNLDIDSDIDSDIENLLWFNVAFENPDFPDLSEEEIRISDAFVPDNIETI